MFGLDTGNMLQISIRRSLFPWGRVLPAAARPPCRVSYVSRLTPMSLIAYMYSTEELWIEKNREFTILSIHNTH